MPWKEAQAVDLRMEVLRRLQDGERATDLAHEYGVSRKTIYKYKRRLEQGGVAALVDQSRRPKRLARQLPPEVEAAVIELRRQHPTWGARKIQTILPRRYKDLSVPTVSTIHGILLKNGCIKRRRLKRTTVATPGALVEPDGPNDVWATDFKGQFRLGDRTYCYPLTVSDLHSRYLLECEALASTREEPVIEAFWELFRECGLPRYIRTDNGVPFSIPRAAWGFSRLTVVWLRLGIKVQRISPGCPQQNGSHERMHRTLKAEATRPAADNLLQQQEKLSEFQKTFNEERPHEAIDMRMPTELYTPSRRPCPKQLPQPRYPLADDVLRVDAGGRLRLSGRHHFYLTLPLVGEEVAIQEQPDGTWLIGFADFDLGVYDPSARRFHSFETLRPSSFGADLT